MTARRPLPKHGTVARYRREVADKKAGKGSGPCERCRTANNARAKTARTNRAALDRRATMKIVELVTKAGHAEDPPAPKRSTRGRRKIGTMEASVQTDIDEIDPSLHVPFHRTLSALALELAQEIDEPATSAAARRDARKQLFEVLKSLRTQKEGDDASALTVLLQEAGFGVPLVPGGPS